MAILAMFCPDKVTTFEEYITNILCIKFGINWRSCVTKEDVSNCPHIRRMGTVASICPYSFVRAVSRYFK
jgi:hypothetical protein